MLFLHPFIVLHYRLFLFISALKKSSNRQQHFGDSTRESCSWNKRSCLQRCEINTRVVLPILTYCSIMGLVMPCLNKKSIIKGSKKWSILSLLSYYRCSNMCSIITLILWSDPKNKGLQGRRKNLSSYSGEGLPNIHSYFSFMLCFYMNYPISHAFILCS